MQGRTTVTMLRKSAWQRALATWESVALAAAAAADDLARVTTQTHIESEKRAWQSL